MPKIQRQRSIGMPNEYNHVHNTDIKGFFLSIRQGNLGKLKKYVEKDKINVNIHDAWDNSPLYLACLCGHTDIVRYLLEKGAHYGGNVESERCFLASLTQNIRDILREYETACVITEDKPDTFYDFLQRLYERVPDYDVEVVVEDQTFLAHKCILTARCSYFYQKVFQQSEGAEDDTIEISDPVFTVTAFRAILQYIYTGRVDIRGNEVSETKKLADYLGYGRLSEVLTIEHRKTREKAGPDFQEEDLLVKVQYKEFFTSLQTDFEKLIYTPPSLGPEKAEESFRHYFTDVCFSVDNVIFECHKMFFYGRSEFFRTLLIDRGDEQPPSFGGYRPTIKLDNVQVLDFKDIVSYLYTDTISIGDPNAEALLILADMYVLPELKKKCIAELNKNLSSSNAIQIYQTAKTLEIPKLVNNSIKVMAHNLLKMTSAPEFQQLLRKELAVLSTGKMFDEIPFFESLQYYIRDGVCGDADATAVANHKISVLNEILKRDHGIKVSLPFLNTTPSASGRKAQKKEDGCIIL